VDQGFRDKMLLHIAVGSLINQVTDELGKVAASVDFAAAEEGEDEEEFPEIL
jgi:hypothetical protein